MDPRYHPCSPIVSELFTSVITPFPVTVGNRCSLLARFPGDLLNRSNHRREIKALGATLGSDIDRVPTCPLAPNRTRWRWHSRLLVSVKAYNQTNILFRYRQLRMSTNATLVWHIDQKGPSHMTLISHAIVRNYCAIMALNFL